MDPSTRPSLFDRLEALLRGEGARFRVLEHPPEGKSDEVALIRGTLPGQGAKAMLCKSKDEPAVFVLAVLSGDRKLDFRKVAQAAGLKKVSLASPEEATREMGAGIGAIPPFTFSERVRLLVDPALVETYDEIAFNAGRLDRSMVLDSGDYLRIAKPQLQDVSA
jgi:Ala-tRNA(Pro) deacylase